MDISKFTNIIQKLSFFKNYSSLLLPIGIIVVAALVFIPIQFMSSKLKAQMTKESVSIGKKVKSLNKSAVPRDQWEVEQGYQQVYEEDANQISLLAIQSSQRELLSYKIFPEPKDTSTLIFYEFGKQFHQAMDDLVSRVNACDKPTDTEFERHLRPDRGADMSLMGIESSSRAKGVSATIREALCRSKAESGSVYINPAELEGYSFWGSYEYVGMEKAVEDCWYWQLAYWIMEDIIDTIASVNAGSNSVFDSSVKRLMKVSFAGSDERSITTDSRPSYVYPTKNKLAEPFTLRFSGDDVDIVHFNFSVVIKAKDILSFIQQLCSAKQHKFRGYSGAGSLRVFKHNQITVLESSINSIDREDESHALYRYGEDAVVSLDLICEYIFNKDGYEQVKPKVVKDRQKP